MRPGDPAHSFHSGFANKEVGGSDMRSRDPLVSSTELTAQLNLIGESPAFQAVLEQIDRFAHCDATILIEGATGTGKELAARAIHYLSPRADGPFIPLNCGAIPDSLIGTELFGHSNGSATPDGEPFPGLIAQADGGTLFLDGIESLSQHAQAALLRFLEDREYRPLGASIIRRADVRVICAANANLPDMVERGELRQDLLYRLNGLSVALPALRDRGDDVILLAQAFVDRLSARYNRPQKSLHPDAIAALLAYDWPGNIRELENSVHREFLLTDGAELCFLTLQAKTQHARVATQPVTPAQIVNNVVALTSVAFREAKARVIADFERAYVTELLARTRGNVSQAARLAGKERSRLGRLVRKYRLSADSYRVRNSAAHGDLN
jgi:DNA-binding NtrC family response regulator